METDPRAIIETEGAPDVSQGSEAKSDTTPQATLAATENLEPAQNTPEPAPTPSAPPHHWEAATAIQPYTQPPGMATTTLPQVYTNTQPTHQQPTIPPHPTPITQSSTETQLAALIQLITQQTMAQAHQEQIRAQQDETMKHAVTTIADSIATIQTEVQQLGKTLNSKVDQLGQEL